MKRNGREMREEAEGLERTHVVLEVIQNAGGYLYRQMVYRGW